MFLCFFAFSVTGLKSQDAAARILKVQGSVQISRPDANGKMDQVDAAAGAAIFAGDVIKTNSGGSLTLKLPDNSQAMISENTTVEIKDITNSPRTIFNVLKGKTRIKIEKLGGKPNPYRVTTPTTVIAVRGTVFDVFVNGDKTEVYVNEGEVSVTNIALAREVILLPGNFTRVERGAPPRPPADFRPQQNDKFFEPKNNPGQERNNNPNNRNQNDKNQNDKGNQPPAQRQPGNTPNQPPAAPPNNPGNQGPPRRPMKEE